MIVSIKAIVSKMHDSIISILVRRLTLSGVERLKRNKDGHWHSGGLTESKGLIYTVPKVFFKEFNNLYPISDVKELRQVLNAEYHGHERVFHVIYQIKDNARQVNSYIFDDKVSQVAPYFCWLLPEPLLICSTSEQEIYAISGNGGNYFCFRRNDGLTVSQSQNAFCPDIDRFKLNNGIARDINSQSFDDVAFFNRLVSVLTSFSFQHWHIFFSLKKIPEAVVPWRRMLAGICGGVAAYLLLATLYLTVVIEKRQSELVMLSTDLTEVLSKQDRLTLLNNSMHSIHSLYQKNANVSYYGLVVLLHMEQSGIQLQSAAMEGNSLKIRGITERATQVVEHLGSLDYVTGVLFSTPTLKTTSGELFDIVVTLAGD